ncbi:MAG: metallopeptidase TldD-related protein [Candidatus Dormibacteria bacterium]
MTPEELLELGLGQGMAVAVATRASSVNFRLANNTLTTNGCEDSLGLGLIALERGRVATQAADVVDEGQVAPLAKAARERAMESPVAPDAMPLLRPGEAAAGQGAGADLGPAQPGDLEGVLEGIHQVLQRSRKEGLRCFGFGRSQVELECLGNSEGLRLQGGRRSAALALTLKTQDLGRSVWAGAMGIKMAELDPVGMYQRLRQRLDWTERRLELPPGRYQVILEPSATADLVAWLYFEMQARGADEGRTVFSGPSGPRVGEAMYAPSVKLSSNPLDPSMAVAPFVRCLQSSEYSSVFDNGLAVPATTWVEGGTQQELMCPRRWAQDHSHPVRPDADNLEMAGSDTSLEEMIKDTERGLLVTSLWYIREVDPTRLLLTGLTRDGVFLIERGQVVGAVNNFRFNESPVGVLQRLMQLGVAQLAYGREIGDYMFVKAPPIRVDGFFMSSVSDAV